MLARFAVEWLAVSKIVRTLKGKILTTPGYWYDSSILPSFTEHLLQLATKIVYIQVSIRTRRYNKYTEDRVSVLLVQIILLSARMVGNLGCNSIYSVLNAKTCKIGR